MVGAAVGARLLFLALHWESSDPFWRDALSSWQCAGFSLTGGFALAAVTGFAASRFVGICPWRLADALIPSVGTAIALTRLGCFLQGCCYGQVTTLPLGVSYGPESPAYFDQFRRGILLPLSLQSLPVHPTQLYEAAAALIIGGVGWAMLRRTIPTGAVALCCGMVFVSIHALNFVLRSPGSLSPDRAWLPPVLDGILIVAMVVLLRMRGHLATPVS